MATIVVSAPADAGVQRKRAGTRPSPLGAALFLYSAITAALFFASYRMAEHHLVYALDDPYITMAMAKSLALHGIWGVTRYGFSSSSSCPLFTLLLAAVYRVTGLHAVTPLILSWGFGAIAIYQADRLLSPWLSRSQKAVALLALVLFAPLFVIGLLGMEHTLHLALLIAFLRQIERPAEAPGRLAMVAALMIATRYEGLFVALAAALLFIMERSWRSLVAVGGGAAAPVAAYGLIARAHGSWFLPNSVALKGTSAHGWALPMVPIWKSIHAPHLFFLVAALGIAGAALRRKQPRCARLAFLLAIAGFGQLTAADTGSAFRYEAYFVAAAVLILAIALSCHRSFSSKSWYALVLTALIAAGLLSWRTDQALKALPGYSQAIYLQQMQSARFLRTYFPRASIAANDIGAISFFTDIRCTDLVGLADSRIFYAKRADRYTTAFLRGETRSNEVQIAIVYDGWFTGTNALFWKGPRLPGEWIRLATMRSPHSEVRGGDVVSFYAVDPSMAGPLRSALRQFEPSLPAADYLNFLR